MRRQQGFVLVVSLIVMTAVLIVVFGASFTSMIDRQAAANQQGANAAYYVAQAGINHFKTLIFKNLVDYYSRERQGWCDPPIRGGIYDELGQPILRPGETTAPIVFGPGTYQVTFHIRDTYMILTSVGRVGRSQTTLQLVATAGAGPAGAWDNAILAAGSTPGSKAINGNVSVYGSIHLVRGDLDLADPGFAFGGNAGVFNNYAGEGSGANDARAIMESITGDRDVDLCSRLKVKSGSVYLESGSSMLGSSVANGALYSIHLGNGRVYRGKPNNATEITDHRTSDLVELRHPSDCASGAPCMNSGYDAYDIGLPVLHENFPNEVPAFTITAAACPWLVSGGRVQLPPSRTGSCGDANGSISWDGSVLTVNGVLNTGSLDVLVSSNIQYQGKVRLRIGTSRSDASALFEVDKSTVLPRGGNFPTQNVLAIETSGNVKVSASGGGGFSPVAALIYAARNAQFEKQVLIAGSIIADTFDMGKNVPKIAYHPAVRDVAEELCLVGTFCYEGEVGPNPGILSDISIERRDTAAID